MVVFARRRHHVAAAAAGLAALTALGVAALAAVLPPNARPADAPPDEFSAARAFEHVRTVGARPHVAGSSANDDVLRYLMRQLTDLDAAPRVQDATGLDTGDPGRVVAARVRNVMGIIEGAEPTGRIFLVAHYDSVQVGPGGNDDGAGVATVLETMRALAAGPRPRNDVVALFTDAEEACLCGAEAFVQLQPLATEGGVVLNFEARGLRGPAIMFETSRGNARLAGVYANVPHPVATSFAVEIYRILPNDTDFTPFRDDHRFTGLNTAYIDGEAAYHTPQDTPARMDRRSLQHHGDNALALARELGAADLTGLREPGGQDATYFPALGGLVRYPGWLVWPLAILAVLAVAAAGWLARERGLVTWPRAAVGFGLALVPLLVAPALAQLVWVALVAARPGYAEMIDPWRPGWFRWAIVALSATLLLIWYAVLRRRLGPVTLALAGLGWLAALGVVLAAFTPGGSYLTALPALFGAGAMVGALLLRQPVAALAALVAGAAVAVVVLAPTILLFFPALGLATAGAPALLTTALGMALLPVLDLLFAPVGRPGHAAPIAGPGPAADPASPAQDLSPEESFTAPSGPAVPGGPADPALAAEAAMAGANPSALVRAAGSPAGGHGSGDSEAGERPVGDPPSGERRAGDPPSDEPAAREAASSTSPGPDDSAAPDDVDADEGTAPPARTAGGRHRRRARRRRALVAALPAAVCGVLAVAATWAGLSTDRFDAAHPIPSQLMYAMDADTGEALWLSNEAEPGAWTSQYVDERRSVARAYPFLEGELATGPAVAADLAPPDVYVASDATMGDEREIRLIVTSHREVRLAYLGVQGSPVVRATVGDRDVPTNQRSRFGVLYHAPPFGGLHVRLVVRPGAALSLRVIDGSTGLSELPDFRPRPPDVGIAGDHASELVLVARTVEVEAEPSSGDGEGPGQGPGQP